MAKKEKILEVKCWGKYKIFVKLGNMVKTFPKVIYLYIKFQYLRYQICFKKVIHWDLVYNMI